MFSDPVTSELRTPGQVVGFFFGVHSDLRPPLEHHHDDREVSGEYDKQVVGLTKHKDISYVLDVAIRKYYIESIKRTPV